MGPSQCLVAGSVSHLIHADRDDYFRAKSDLESVLVPAFKRAVTKPIAIFIDNIDEYFNRHLDPKAAESVAGVLEPERAEKDPVAAYFGFSQIRHKQVKCDEDLFQYLSRHTLSRPRDLMQIGKALSRLAPEERSRETVRSVVQEVAADIVATYLSEVRPHIDSIDLPRGFLPGGLDSTIKGTSGKGRLSGGDRLAREGSGLESA